MLDKNRKGLILIGSGGHAKSCMDIIESIRDYSISLQGKVNVIYKVRDSRQVSDGRWKTIVALSDLFVLGVGQIHNADVRKSIVEKVTSYGGGFVTLISPYARVSPRSRIGEGTVIMPGAIINSGANIGEFCIINSGAIVEHDSVVGDFCHISTGAVVNGDCSVGHETFFGSNAVLLNQLSVADNTTIGAGSVVTKTISEPGGIYVGNPAKLLRTKH